MTPAISKKGRPGHSFFIRSISSVSPCETHLHQRHLPRHRSTANGDRSKPSTNHSPRFATCQSRIHPLGCCFPLFKKQKMKIGYAFDSKVKHLVRDSLFLSLQKACLSKLSEPSLAIMAPDRSSWECHVFS